MIKMDMFNKKKISELEVKLAETEAKLAEASRENTAKLEQREAEYKTQEGTYVRKLNFVSQNLEEYKTEVKKIKEECVKREIQTGVVTLVPSKLNILLVEDKDKHLESVVDVEAAGHKVDVARDYSQAIAKLDEMAKSGTPYDVVLSDMMFPYGSTHPNAPICREKVREEAALGYAVALYASQRGVKAVAIVTDMSHHAGAVAATFDDFVKKSPDSAERVAFNLSGTTVVMYDCRDLASEVEFGKGSKPWINAVKILQENGYGRSSYPLWSGEEVVEGGVDF